MTLAASAEYSALLDQIERDSLAELGLALAPFFDDLGTYLVDLANRIKQPDSGRNPHYTAARIIRAQGPRITEQVLEQIRGYFRDLTPDQQEDQLWQYNFGNPGELDLIDLQEFEDFLAIDRMIATGEDLYKVTLEALTLRLALLIDAWTWPDIGASPATCRPTPTATRRPARPA